jgi:hypothetical protein
MNNNWDYTYKVKSKKYWFEVPRDPSLAFIRPESPKLA